jgi:Cof subfamily protein (haloacid dehalogenase superfamily)
VSPRDRAAVWVLDLDGTLLGPDHRLHADTIDALCHAHEAGVHVVVATGRILAATRPVLAALPFEPWCICAGGQTVMGPGEAPTVTATLHPDHVADALARAVAHADVGVQLYTADDQAMWRPNDAGVHLATSESIRFRALEALPEPPPGDLIKIVFTAEADAACTLDGAFTGPLPYSYTPTGPRYRDVLPTGVDKGAALDRLLARTGWPADQVLAAGDAANDLPVFARARWRVAVEGRCPPLVARATCVVPTNADGAVGRALRAHL